MCGSILKGKLAQISFFVKFVSDFLVPSIKTIDRSH